MFAARSSICRACRKAARIRPARTFATAHSGTQSPPSDNYVKLVEVGPRDGLQNEKTAIPLATKIELIEKLAKTGIQDVRTFWPSASRPTSRARPIRRARSPAAWSSASSTRSCRPTSTTG